MKLFLIIYFACSAFLSYGQFNQLEWDLVNNGIVLKYNTDYEKYIKANHVKRSTSFMKYGDPAGANPSDSLRTYEYDTEGRIIETREYRHNKTVKKYDNAGKLVEKVEINLLTNDTSVKWNFEYDERNKMTKKTCWVGDGQKTYIRLDKNFYDEQGRLNKQEEQFQGDTIGTHCIYNYSYDDRGNLSAFKKTYNYSYSYFGNFDIRFSYDSLNRVIEIKYERTGIDYKITYNANGQIASFGVNYPAISYYPNGLIKTFRMNNEVDTGLYTITFTYEFYDKRKKVKGSRTQ